MKKKLLFGLLVFTLVALTLFAACAEPTPEPSPAPAASPAPAPAPAPAPSPAPAPPPSPAPPTPAEKIKLIIHGPNPPTAAPSITYQAWADKMTELCGDRIEIVPYFAGSLFTQQEAIKSMLAGGTCDIHFAFMAGEAPNLMPLNLFIDLPFLGWTGAENGVKVMEALFQKFPEMTEEFQGLKVLYVPAGADVNWIMSPSKQVLTTEDLKGMKFIAHGYSAKWYEAVGATPVKLSWPEFYTSMEKGVVDATVSHFGPAMGSGMIELYRYYSKIPTTMSQSFFPAIMNMDSWNSLPPDIQKIIVDLKPWFNEKWLEESMKCNIEGEPMAREMGATFVDISPEVVQEWVDAAKPIHEEWITDVEAKGKPARALYEELMRLLEEYK